MKAPKIVFSCQECGAQSPKWLGRCQECGAWNSMAEERAVDTASPAAVSRYSHRATSASTLYADVETANAVRLSTGIGEFDRVLGGGVVPGSLVLLGGEPGIGKSTLLLQAAAHFAREVGPVLYASGEESEHQIKSRGDRLGIGAAPLYLMSETCIERILEEIARVKPALVIVDSVQTVFSIKFQSAPGTIGQVREAATQFLFAAKGQNIPTILVGHVTKDGNLAGPKVLEHVVDTVLYFEGERHHAHRVVRAVKNRFGAVSELGVFEMTGTGLVPVPNPSKLFLAERASGTAGSAVLCCIEGSRPILVEVQALVSTSSYGNARRMAIGIDGSRLSLLLAVLEKRAGLNLAGDDVYVNVAGGMSVDEPAADLSVLAAVASSVRNRGLSPSTAIFGEVGLSGEIRGVPQAALRVREAAQMGFTRLIVPAANAEPANTLRADVEYEVVGVRTLGEALDQLIAGFSEQAVLAFSLSYLRAHSGREPLMSWFVLARVLFVAAVGYSAFQVEPFALGAAGNIAVGLGVGAGIVALEISLKGLSVTSLLGAILGGAIGLLAAESIGASLYFVDHADRRVVFLHGLLLLALPYLGLVIGGRKSAWLEPANLAALFRGAAPKKTYRILDTSVIIDGRIADICETGFMDGTLIVPQFVLKELQMVADSSDSMKRNRGRRGLDILQKIQKMASVDVQISDKDFPEVREVDLKLIELARTLGGKIVTNDFNLNKVAQLRGVEVLNINELANSLKPVVLPGEIMKVFILKEGKEYNQGVAYLDDGTMVVVDNARKLIGKTIDVVVTSVLQTTAGKMIFGRYIDSTTAAQTPVAPARSPLPPAAAAAGK